MATPLRSAGGAEGGFVFVKGLKEIQAKLKALEPKLAKKVVRAALKKSAEPILHAARSKAPVDTGFLVSSIKLTTALSRRKGTMTVRVGTSKGFYKGDDFYASFIEFGYRRGARRTKTQLGLPDARQLPNQIAFTVAKYTSKVQRAVNNQRPWVPAQPFLRPAYDENKERALNILTTEILSGIEREAPKK